MHNWLKLIYPKCTTGLSKHVSDETDKKELMEKLHEMEQKGLVNPESSQKESPWQKYRYTVYFLLLTVLLLYRYIRDQYHLDEMSLFILVLLIGLYLFMKFKKK